MIILNVIETKSSTLPTNISIYFNNPKKGLNITKQEEKFIA